MTPARTSRYILIDILIILGAKTVLLNDIYTFFFYLFICFLYIIYIYPIYLRALKIVLTN